jgi:predicted GIY-YIG superfamily endonuclease
MINNGQSAAKLLKNLFYEEGSTTIPRKGSTDINSLEKVGIKTYTFNETLPNLSGIYAIVCFANNKFYIGSCINFHARMIRHRSYLKRNKHHSLKFQNSFNKYGIDNFKLIWLESLNENLKEKEEVYINYFNSFEKGLNASLKCVEPKNFKLSQEAINKVIENRSKAVVCLDLEGNYLTTYKSIVEAAKTIKDQSTNISSCCKGKLNYVKDFIFVYKSDYDLEKNYKYTGRKYVVTEEHRKNLSKALKGKPRNFNKQVVKKLIERSSKKVIRINIEDNTENEYANMKTCYIENNFGHRKLQNLIKNQTPFKGFMYKFL